MRQRTNDAGNPDLGTRGRDGRSRKFGTPVESQGYRAPGRATVRWSPLQVSRQSRTRVEAGSCRPERISSVFDRAPSRDVETPRVVWGSAQIDKTRRPILPSLYDAWFTTHRSI